MLLERKKVKVNCIYYIGDSRVVCWVVSLCIEYLCVSWDIMYIKDYINIL